MITFWSDITGYMGRYSISNQGVVKSAHMSKPVSIGDNGRGYLYVSLYKNNNRKNFYVHRLVAIHFVYNSNPKEYDCVNHIDGNKNNNHYTNLEWCTHKMNNSHAVNTGLCDGHIGIGNHACVYSDDVVVDIFKLYATGLYSCSKIAEKFGSTADYVNKILIRSKRHHVKIDDNLLMTVRYVRAMRGNLSKLRNEIWFDGFMDRLKAKDRDGYIRVQMKLNDMGE